MRRIERRVRGPITIAVLTAMVEVVGIMTVVASFVLVAAIVVGAV